jgi:23S rRNA A2030 N6-methylase RlmJ
MLRDIPSVTTTLDWTVEAVRAALDGHTSGSFAGSAMLCDAMVRDDDFPPDFGGDDLPF